MESRWKINDHNDVIIYGRRGSVTLYINTAPTVFILY